MLTHLPEDEPPYITPRGLLVAIVLALFVGVPWWIGLITMARYLIGY